MSIKKSHILAFCLGAAAEFALCYAAVRAVSKNNEELQNSNARLSEAVEWQAETISLMGNTIGVFHEHVDEDTALRVRELTEFDWVVHGGVNTPKWIADLLNEDTL